MNKKLIRLTESDLHRIVKESVNKILNEVGVPNYGSNKINPNRRDGDYPIKQPSWVGDKKWDGWNGEDPEWIMNHKNQDSSWSQMNEGFFDKFRRTSTTRDALKGLGDSRYKYTYDKDKDRYFYRDEAGNKHDTGIGYGKGNVGSNWNPLKWFNSGDNQVTPEDAKYVQQRLQRWNGDGNKDPFHYSFGDERTSIDRNVKNERETQRQAERQAQRRREEEKYQYERPHRIGPAKTDQAGHIRAYFDDDAAYDAGLR